MFVFQVRTLSRTDEARGLFWLMEEEVLQPGGSEETLLQRLFSYYGPAEGESTGHTHKHARTQTAHTYILPRTNLCIVFLQVAQWCLKVKMHITSCSATVMGQIGWNMTHVVG